MPLESADGLRTRDYLLLVALCACLFGYALIDGRLLSEHETVHCQNVREMLADGDWLMPHYGGRVWLERPPLPHWLTALPAVLSGHTDQAWSMMLGSILMGTTIVLLTANLAGRWYGRTIGMLSGAVLATMQEFVRFACGPECDIFLCGLIALALVLFARGAIPSAAPAAPFRFFGPRSWDLLGFFVLLGLANMAKGLFFGMIHIALPVIVWLVWNRDAYGLRRLTWFWGWLAFGVAALTWPTITYLREPGVTELWYADYGGRTIGNYMYEPWWYYLVNFPWMVFPWTALAGAGVLLTARSARLTRYAPERLLWAWALAPLLFFSLLKGKHHHYLLHILAPWSVLSAHALHRFWQLASQSTSWLRRPAWALIVPGLPGIVALVLARRYVAEPALLLAALAAGWLAFVWGCWWCVVQRDGRVAGFIGFALLVGAYLVGVSFQTHLREKYRPDWNFVQRASERTAGSPLYVLNDPYPLNASWVLFYLNRPAQMLHNATFLCDPRLDAQEAYVIARRSEEAALSEYGQTEIVDESSLSRERSNREGSRWTLFRLRLRPDLPHPSYQVHVSPAQAAGRKPGPYLH